MKLIDTPEVVPSRLLGLARLLRTSPDQTLPRAKASALLMPPSLRANEQEDNTQTSRRIERDSKPDDRMFGLVVDAALELGMIEILEDDVGEPCLRLARSTVPTAQADTTEAWAGWVCQRVLNDLVNERSRKLATVLAWMLTIPLERMPVSRNDWKERFKADGLDRDAFGLNNDARWDNIFYWARFLGWTWQLYFVGLDPGVICTPSRFIVQSLPDLLPDEGAIVASEWRSALGARFRALDGGDFFRDISSRVWRARGDLIDRSDRWSPGMSRAIRELRARNILDYDCPDDQRTFLLFDDGTKVGRVWRARRNS